MLRCCARALDLPLLSQIYRYSSHATTRSRRLFDRGPIPYALPTPARRLSAVTAPTLPAVPWHRSSSQRNRVTAVKHPGVAAEDST
eukprot:5862779-Pleurochrysis_carterae.AAC.1